MVATILPVVNGERKYIAFPRLLLLYTGAAMLGASITGAVIGRVGLSFATPFSYSLSSARTLALGIVGLILSVIELRIFSWSLPQQKRQVPQRWKLSTPTAMVCSYGGVLGLEFGTRLPVATLYIVGFFCFLCRNTLWASAVFACFGFGRALALWLVRRALRRSTLHEVIAEIAKWHEVVPVANALALAFFGSLAVVLWLWFKS